MFRLQNVASDNKHCHPTVGSNLNAKHGLSLKKKEIMPLIY